jgi:Tol biopolymer transport system component
MSDPISRLNAALEGRYRIERQLGEGGMAVVYLADDLRHERKVALKVLKLELAAVVGAERFLAEIKTTANLQHPHILPLFDSGEADGFLFYVMPYVEGESLRDRLDRTHQLPVDEAVQIAIDVAEALEAAHERGVIHRDIKPANILLSRGRPLVADFGIALAVSAAGGGRLTETGLSVGTPYYMSPEQATGDTSLGAASDTYALGCVLYEMLAGSPPHVGSNAQAILAKILTGEIEPLSRHRRSVPPNVEAAVRKALEKVPADRFPSARQFGQALADPAFRYGGGTANAPGRRIGTMVASVALGALLGGAAMWSLRGSAPAEPVLFLEAPPEGTRFADAPLVSPDERWLAMLVDEGSETVIWVRSLDGEEARRLDGTAGASVMFWAPTSDELAFEVADELRRIRVDGSGNRLVAALQVSEGVWMPGGELVVTSPEQGIVTFPATGGEPRTVVQGLQYRALDLVAQGPFLLYGQFGGETGIHSLNLATGDQRLLVPGVNGRARYVAPDLFVYLRNRVLVAQRFRPSDMELLGDPFPVAEDVRSRLFTGSAGGALTFIRGGDETERIVWLDRNGEAIGEAAPEGQYTEVYLSTDGGRMMFTRTDPASGNDDLWVQDLREDGAPNRFTSDVDTDHLAAFSTDGRRIAWEAHAGGVLNLMVRPADGSAPATLVRNWGRGGGPVDWSPDGRFVLYFTLDGATGWNLWAVPMDGSGEPFPLIESEFNHPDGRFSPDGHWLAYTSDASGAQEIYLQRLEDMRPVGGAQRVSNGGGQQPQWRRDGAELFFVSDQGLMAVDTRLDQDLPAGVPHRLFQLDDPERPGDQLRGGDRNRYAVAPDGQRFLVRVPEHTPGVGSAVIIHDWAAGLDLN